MGLLQGVASINLDEARADQALAGLRKRHEADQAKHTADRAGVCCLLLGLIVYGAYSISTFGSRWFSSGANTMLRRMKSNVTAGNITDRAGRLLATTNDAGKRVYPQDSDTCRAWYTRWATTETTCLRRGILHGQLLYAFNQSYLTPARRHPRRAPARNDIKLSWTACCQGRPIRFSLPARAAPSSS